MSFGRGPGGMGLGFGILINLRDVGAAQLFQEAAGGALFKAGIGGFEPAEKAAIADPL